MCICRDKSKLDIPEVRRQLKKGLDQNYYLTGREWVYKDVPRRTIAEKYIADESDGDLKDYKVMCFGGRARCCFVCSGRHSPEGLSVTFFDRNWNMMPFERRYPAKWEGLKRPEQYGKMLELAETLAVEMPFVRVDFYEVSGKLYFGELTFYPGSGFEEFTPEAWDDTLGSWLELPEKE